MRALGNGSSSAPLTNYSFWPILLKNSHPVFGGQESTNFWQALGHESSVKRRCRAKSMRNRLLMAVVFSANF
jgi:hypothetical protein